MSNYKPVEDNSKYKIIKGPRVVPTHLEPNPDPDYESFYSSDRQRYNDMKHVAFTPVVPCRPYTEDKIKSITDLGWRIRRWWINDFCYIWYNLKNGIINCYAWFKIIWKGRDWDNIYLWEMMLFKLKRMQEPIREHVYPGPHMIALDRAVVVLEELIKRSQCECDHLHSFTEISIENGKMVKSEGADTRLEVCHACCQTQKDLLKEFSEIFAEFSPMWWD